MDMLKGDLSDAMSDSEFDDLHLQRLVQDSTDHDGTDNMTTANTARTEVSVGGSAAPVPKKKYDPKDPLRPRRKKARRACYACQRAHLTCGDERPCQRCIKRGLAEGCQDGVRKKAKYLHDAPVEALGGVLGPTFNTGGGAAKTTPTRLNGRRHPSSAGSDVSASNVSTFFTPSNNTSTYPVFSTTAGQTPTAGGGGGLSDTLTFPNPQSPISPSYVPAPPSNDGGGASAGFSPALFDPSNPALFNFNLEGISFGSQYAAMEFGMLGHMSSGAAVDDPSDLSSSSLMQTGQPTTGFGNAADVFGGGGGGGGGGLNPTLYDGSGGLGNGSNDYMSMDASVQNFYSQGNLQHGLPHAYAIAAAPPSLQSPSTDNNSPQPTATGGGGSGGGGGFDNSPTTSVYGLGGGAVAASNGNGNGRASFSQATAPAAAAAGAPLLLPAGVQPSQPSSKARSAASRLLPQSILGKRQRDTTSIYEAVKEPYMYVHGFHRLIALLQGRYSATKILRIAKALSSIRPSFISCTRTLNRQDLVFMEKCFQRTLFEYEEFMAQVSSPALVCRRTGEVAAVNKEFTALTGWTKEVLLGQEPNLNINTGGAGGASTPGMAVTGPAPPNRLRAVNAELAKVAATATAAAGTAADGKPQPLFIAELMDDDNVIEFYEDFAQLAFGDSRGSVNRKGRLLKYRTRAMLDAAGGSSSAAGSVAAVSPRPTSASASNTNNNSGSSNNNNNATTTANSSILSSRVARIDGEHGISKIERDGKLECSYCWHIRRDTFDIPMMIVMNFLPCYYPNQEPHQLAV